MGVQSSLVAARRQLPTTQPPQQMASPAELQQASPRVLKPMLLSLYENPESSGRRPPPSTLARSLERGITM